MKKKIKKVTNCKTFQEYCSQFKLCSSKCEILSDESIDDHTDCEYAYFLLRGRTLETKIRELLQEIEGWQKLQAETGERCTELEEQNKIMKECVDFYANCDNWQRVEETITSETHSAICQEDAIGFESDTWEATYLGGVRARITKIKIEQLTKFNDEKSRGVLGKPMDSPDCNTKEQDYTLQTR